eukprot:jgi/Mesen1/9649/ME000671S09016
MKSRGRDQELAPQFNPGRPAGSSRRVSESLKGKCIIATAVILAIHIIILATYARERSKACSPEGAGYVGDNGLGAGGSNRLTSSPPRFILYRLIGNNMPPLQCPSQLLWNTQYAVAHEPELAGCRKRWVLNQVMNATERALLLDTLLDRGGCQLDDIIVRRLNISAVAAHPRDKWLEMVTAQNEARNQAIEDGIRAGATWILPFDGNHFITTEAWAAIVRSADEADARGFKYFKARQPGPCNCQVPVHRLHRQQDVSWVNAGSTFRDIKKHAPIMIESQLAFHRDSTERFQTGMVYGQQNKLELLSRACGSPPKEQEEEKEEYVPKCQCADLGQEGQPHESSDAIAAACGYSLRLWFFPCNGTDPDLVFNNGLYRKRMRHAARKEMYQRIKRAIKNPKVLDY